MLLALMKNVNANTLSELLQKAGMVIEWFSRQME